MFAAVAGRTKQNTGHLAISIVPGQCSNLKSALKAIIRDATNQDSIRDGDEETVGTRQVRVDFFLLILNILTEQGRPSSGL